MGAVAKKKSAELSTEVMDDVWADAGKGASFKEDEMQVPFLRLAQDMSPQTKKNKPEFIDGLEYGGIFNTLTSEFWLREDGLRVIVCDTVTKYTEWVPRDNGGGFVSEIDADDPVLEEVVREKGADVMPNGNHLIKADNFYCLYESADGGWNPAILDMKITQLKIGRRWKSKINICTMKHPQTGQVAKAPIFANIWKISSVDETNKNNDTYANYSVDMDTKNFFFDDMDLYQQAKSLATAVAAGDLKESVDPEKQTKAPPVDKDQEIPF